MQVFKLFLKLFRSYIPSCMIYIVVFFALAIPLSKLGASQVSFEEKQLKICIFDEDNTASSKALIEHLGKKNKIMDIGNDNKQILDSLYYNYVDYVFTINKGYEKLLTSTEAGHDSTPYFSVSKMHQSYSVVLMEQYLDEYIHTVRAYSAAGNDLETSIKKAEETASKEADVTYENFRANESGEKDFDESNAYYFRYLPYVFICIFVNALAPVLIAFNKKDQRYRVNASCFKQSKLTLQLFFGSAVIVSVVWLIFFIGGSFIGNNGMYSGVAWIAVLNSFIFALISIMITLLVSSFTPSESVINLIAQIISLGMSFMCGIFVPQSMLGDGVLTAAKFLPAYWYTRANDSLGGITSYNISDIWMSIGVEFGFLILLIFAYMFVNARKSNKGGVKKHARQLA